MTLPEDPLVLLDPSKADVALWRISISTFTYYDAKDVEEPGYSIDEDVEWCLGPLTGIPGAPLAELRATIRVLITTPAADRRPYLAYLNRVSEIM